MATPGRKTFTILEFASETPSKKTRPSSDVSSPRWVRASSEFEKPNVNLLFDRDLPAVKFYDAHTDSENYRFSAFALFPMSIDGLEFGTVEHYIEHQKFLPTDPDFAERLRRARSPYECKKMTKDYERNVRGADVGKGDPAWISGGHQLSAMRKALFNKAMQWPEFLNDLIATGRAYILQDSPFDSFWGAGREGKGSNTMGKLLIELRAELISAHHLRFQSFEPKREPIPTPRGERGARGGRGGGRGGRGEYFPRVPRGAEGEKIDVDDYNEVAEPSRTNTKLETAKPSPKKSPRRGKPAEVAVPSSSSEPEVPDESSEWSESSSD